MASDVPKLSYAIFFTCVGESVSVSSFGEFARVVRRESTDHYRPANVPRHHRMLRKKWSFRRMLSQRRARDTINPFDEDIKRAQLTRARPDGRTLSLSGTRAASENSGLDLSSRTSGPATRNTNVVNEPAGKREARGERPRGAMRAGREGGFSAEKDGAAGYTERSVKT